MKPVMYLDVDGTLIQFREDRTRLHYEMHRGGFPAKCIGEFLQWADHNFEVRWLTAWCPSGIMRRREELEAILWENIPETWNNPKQWWNYKPEAIDLDDPRPWFWVDDEVKYESQFVPEHLHMYLIQTRSSYDPYALCKSALEIYYKMPEGWEIEFPAWASQYPTKRIYE